MALSGDDSEFVLNFISENEMKIESEFQSMNDDDDDDDTADDSSGKQRSQQWQQSITQHHRHRDDNGGFLSGMVDHQGDYDNIDYHQQSLFDGHDGDAEIIDDDSNMSPNNDEGDLQIVLDDDLKTAGASTGVAQEAVKQRIQGLFAEWSGDRRLPTPERAVEQRLTCSYCGKTFSRKDYLLSHLNSVHFMLKPLTCGMCKHYSTTCRRNLQRHVQRNHRKQLEQQQERQQQLIARQGGSSAGGFELDFSQRTAHGPQIVRQSMILQSYRNIKPKMQNVPISSSSSTVVLNPVVPMMPLLELPSDITIEHVQPNADPPVLKIAPAISSAQVVRTIPPLPPLKRAPLLNANAQRMNAFVSSTSVIPPPLKPIAMVQSHPPATRPTTSNSPGGSGERLPCKFCSASFTRRENLKMHISVIHFNQRAFACHICSFKTSDKRTIVKHFQLTHPGEEIPEKMKLAFTDLTYLKSNRTSFGAANDTSNIQFLNDVDDDDQDGDQDSQHEMFSVDPEVVLDESSDGGLHSATGATPERNSIWQRDNSAAATPPQPHPVDELTCPFCFKRFSRKDKVKYHVEHLHLQTMIKGKVIGSNVVSLQQQHPLQHQQQQQQQQQLFKCEFCSHMFSRKDNLKAHISSVHLLLKAYRCCEYGCDYATSDKRGFTRHYERRHPGREVPNERQKYDLNPLQFNQPVSSAANDEAEDNNERMHYEAMMMTRHVDAPPLPTTSIDNDDNHSTLGDDDDVNDRTNEFNEVVLDDDDSENDADEDDGAVNNENNESISIVNLQSLQDNMDDSSRLDSSLTGDQIDGLTLTSDCKQLVSCKLCGKAFSRRDNLKAHIKVVHFNVKPFKCPATHCTYTTAEKRGLANHILKNHTESAFQTGEKTPPDIEFQAQLNRQMVKVHNSQSSSNNHNISGQLGVTFETVRKMMDEQKAQASSARVLRCHVCSYTSTHKKNLYKHIYRQHKGEKMQLDNVQSEATSAAFPCSQCGKSFSCNFTLQRHLLSVHMDLDSTLLQMIGQQTTADDGETADDVNSDDNDGGVDEQQNDEKTFASTDDESAAMDPSLMCQVVDGGDGSRRNSLASVKERAESGDEKCVTNNLLRGIGSDVSVTSNWSKNGNNIHIQQNGKTVHSATLANGSDGHEQEKPSLDQVLSVMKRLYSFTCVTVDGLEKVFHKCHFCQFAASQQRIVLAHMVLSHAKAKSHDCSQCTYRSISKEKLTKHVEEMHSDEKKFKCSICKYAVLERWRLDRHMHVSHNYPLGYASADDNNDTTNDDDHITDDGIVENNDDQVDEEMDSLADSEEELAAGSEENSFIDDEEQHDASPPPSKRVKVDETHAGEKPASDDVDNCDDVEEAADDGSSLDEEQADGGDGEGGDGENPVSDEQSESIEPPERPGGVPVSTVNSNQQKGRWSINLQERSAATGVVANSLPATKQLDDPTAATAGEEEEEGDESGQGGEKRSELIDSNQCQDNDKQERDRENVDSENIHEQCGDGELYDGETSDDEMEVGEGNKSADTSDGEETKVNGEPS